MTPEEKQFRINQLQYDITSINSALSKLAIEKTTIGLRIGSGDSQREYKFQPSQVQDLINLRNIFQNELNDLLYQTTEVTPTFRSFGYIPLKVTKME